MWLVEVGTPVGCTVVDTVVVDYTEGAGMDGVDRDPEEIASVEIVAM